MKLQIENKLIGSGNPCFIIAEAGVNHNGRLDLSLGLVDAAANAGADAVKFQTFKAEEVVTAEGKMALYQEKNIGKRLSQQEMLRSLELPVEFYPEIIRRCQERNILFMSTPHGGKASVDFLESLGMGIYKIGSGDLTNYILLNRVAKTNKPIILSSGMADLKEVKDAIRFIRSKGNDQLAILHCTTNYPCPPQEVNLLAMKTMMDELDIPVGFSDHTQGNQAAIMAAALGMAIYECHFTLDKNLLGPDHIASAEPEELKSKIRAIRDALIILGNAAKIPNESELKSMVKVARRSIVAAKNLPSGHIIDEDDLEAKRPGDGISPTRYEEFLGKKIKNDLKKDHKISEKDFEAI